jgi:hypothetical protein
VIASVQLTHLLQESRASSSQPASIGLQAGQYGHVPLLQDASAKPLHVSTAGLVAALAIALSYRDGWY